MSNTFGKNITLTIFGESHGEAVGCVLDGLGAGIRIDHDYIKCMLARRMPGSNDTERKEPDDYKIISGVYRGFTTGDSIAVVIENKSTSGGCDHTNIPRPSHADYSSLIRSKGFADMRSGGHLSGRLTAPIVAAGAIVMKVLEDRCITIKTTVKSIAGIDLAEFGANAKDIIEKALVSAKNAGDSIGGVLTTTIEGVDAGVGEPFFDSLESMLAHAVFSIPAVKGIEFGLGFSMCDKTGSRVSDEFAFKDGKVITTTNNNGGINGGITNGMPIVFNTAIKPVPSIAKEQQSINLQTKESETIIIQGQNDTSIIPRVSVVLECLSALVIADLLSLSQGKLS